MGNFPPFFNGSIYISEKLTVEWTLHSKNKSHIPDFVFICFVLLLFYVLFHFMEEEKIGLKNLVFIRLYQFVSQLMDTVFSPIKSELPTLTFYHFSQNSADCGQMQPELNLTVSPDMRKNTACKPEIAYGKFKSSIYSSIKHDIL